MSYREQDGQVILTMPREDYEIVLLALGAFTAINETPSRTAHMVMVMNRLNEGNPNYRPYQVTDTPNAPPGLSSSLPRR